MDVTEQQWLILCIRTLRTPISSCEHLLICEQLCEVLRHGEEEPGDLSEVLSGDVCKRMF